ncbi:MAG: lipopolysaccharide biosynthesis protein [Bacteroidia bacterium]|nr:lipopolysaccharide biosynthesis protein [Bacteroidia bacterium]
MADSALKKKTTVSLFWSFLDKFGHQAINLLSSIILMAIVAKSEFAIMGILAIFTAFSSILIDSGFSRALLNRKDISVTEYTSVFYFNVGLSALLYLLLFFTAPYLADIFHEQKITPVSRILFLSFIFNGLGLIHQTLLTKKADFRGLTKINIPSVLLSAIVSVIMALAGYGIWALVAQVVSYSFFRAMLLWMYSSWRPAFVFSMQMLKNSMAFSNKLLAGSLISAVFNNIYPSLIAFFFPNSMNSVADYDRANRYQDIPFAMISNTFRSISMLILSEINQEIERLKRVVSKLLKSIAFLSFPIGFYMILVAEAVFAFIWQEKWLSAVPYFRILTLAGIASPFIFVLNELYIAKERADFFLGLEIVKRIILVLLIWLLIPQGISGLAVSWVIYTYITLIISLFLSDKLIRYSGINFLKDALPYALVALGCTALGYFSTQWIENNFFFIVANFIIVGGSYLLLCRIFKLEMIKEIEDWFSSRKQKKNYAE